MAEVLAVLTGDIVGSTSVSGEAQAELPGELRNTFEEVQRSSGGKIERPIDVYRGDGWQVLVEDPRAALWAAASMRALLQWGVGVDTRVSIAVGGVTRISDESVGQSVGEAFERSGRGLDVMERRGPKMTCWVRPPSWLEGRDGRALHRVGAEALCEVVDVVAGGWTRNQAQAVGRSLRSWYAAEEKSQEAIAGEWKPDPVNQATVSRHLSRAHWDPLERALKRFETFVAVSTADGPGAE